MVVQLLYKLAKHVIRIRTGGVWENKGKVEK
jgi:hypothetical protein